MDATALLQKNNKDIIGELGKENNLFTDSRPLPVYESLGNNPLMGPKYIAAKLANGNNHTQFIGVGDAIGRDGWNLSRPGLKETFPVNDGSLRNPKYRFMAPTASFSQNVVQDVKEPARRNGYVPYQTNSANLNDFDKYVQEKLSNIFNASITGTKNENFKNSVEYDAFAKKLADKMEKEPAYFDRMASLAEKNVRETMYVPFDRREFIGRCRIGDSAEFASLTQAVTGHLLDKIRGNPTFQNADFNALAEGVMRKNSVLNLQAPSGMDEFKQNAKEFVKENVKEDKKAETLVDTFLGTIIETAKKIKQQAKNVVFAAVLASCLYAAGCSTGVDAAPVEQGQNTEFSVPSVRSGTPLTATINVEDFKLPDKPVTLGEQSFTKKEIANILNFYSQPFDLDGDSKETVADFKMADSIQSALLPYLENKKISPDELKSGILQRQSGLFAASVLAEAERQQAGNFSAQDLDKAFTAVFQFGAQRMDVYRDVKDNGEPHMQYAMANLIIKNHGVALPEIVRNIKTGNQASTANSTGVNGAAPASGKSR